MVREHSWHLVIRSFAKNIKAENAMKAPTILTNILSLVSYKMHKTRRNALISCVNSLLHGNAATVTSIGRGIFSKAFEKHRIKRADRLLSNTHLQREIPHIYAVLCHLFCTAKRPVISVDWSDLDDCKRHFLLRASITVKGRPITLYQEVHTNKTKEKPATHKAFLEILQTMLPGGCRPIIVTDAGYKSPWFREVVALKWDMVGRVRKPHFYSVNYGKTWQCISHLYQQASARPKRFDNAQIARRSPFACTLVLIKQKNKGRHARNPDGSQKCSKRSLKHAEGATDPWLLATSLPNHRLLAKQVVGIYRQRMQIEEGFRDMKSSRFGLGFEQNKSIKTIRLSVLVLLTSLASVVAILLGITLVIANKHRRFQANTDPKQTLSFHTLGLRALACKMRLTQSQFRRAIKWLDEQVDTAWLRGHTG